MLFQGFNGTPIEITTVVMGFMQICSGVVLLQLSKSAKDVPDAAVFKGDLDQVRTVAEQEEPEYEPRADSIRGGAALLRSISKMRQSKQMQEIGRLREEHMAPISENEQVEFDGLRRRRTILAPGEFPSSPGVNRRKTIHPPLGMSHFPTEEEPAEDEDMHPGFFRPRKKRDHSSTVTADTTNVPLSPVKGGSVTIVEDTTFSQQQQLQPDVYGLPSSLHRQDTAYKGASFAGQGQTQHIQFAPNAGPSSPPPPPPPHKEAAKRQFSFHNPFHRTSSPNPASSSRPVSRGALSFATRRSTSNRHGGEDRNTEEERLGLVKGDSARGYGFAGGSPDGSDDGDRDGDGDGGEKEKRKPGLTIDLGKANRRGGEEERGERLPSAKMLRDGRYRADSDGSEGSSGGEGRAYG